MRGPKSREPLEELAPVLRHESGPRVPDRDLETLGVADHAETDLAFGATVLRGVAEEVDQHDPDERRIALRRHRSGRQTELEAHARLVDLGPYELDRGRDDLLDDVHILATRQLQPAAVDPRQVKVILDEVEQVLPLRDHSLHLLDLPRFERPEIAVGQQARIGDQRGDRVLDLVADEREHLEVGVVRGGELLDAPRFLHRLAETLRDRHLELHVVAVKRVRAAGVPEQEADDAALDDERTGEARADALAYEQSGRVAGRVLSRMGLEVVDDARLAALDHVLERAASKVGDVALCQPQRLVVGARVVSDKAPFALVHERQPDAVARDELAGALEHEVGEVVQRLLGRHLLVDHAKGGALVLADATTSGSSAKRVQIAKRRLQAQDRPSSGWLPR